MTPSLKSTFKQDYQKHLQHLKLKGLQPKTIDAYARAIRRIGKYFDHHINDLSEQQLVDYFVDLQDRLSWSAVKLDLYGLKFFYRHVFINLFIHFFYLIILSSGKHLSYNVFLHTIIELL